MISEEFLRRSLPGERFPSNGLIFAPKSHFDRDLHRAEKGSMVKVTAEQPSAVIFVARQTKPLGKLLGFPDHFCETDTSRNLGPTLSLAIGWAFSDPDGYYSL